MPSETDEGVFQRLFGQLSDCAMLIEPSADGPPIIRDANAASLRSHGYAREELVGRPITMIIATPNEAATRARAREVLEKGSLRFEAAHQRKDGSTFIAEVVLSRVRLGGDDLMIAVQRDLTDRERAIAALTASQRMFAQAFHKSPTANSITRLADATVLDVNESYERITGFSRDETIGRRASDLDVWVDYAQRRRMEDEVRAKGFVRDFEGTFRRKSGELAVGLVSASIIDVDGEACLLTQTIDISERHRAQARLEFLVQTLETAPAAAYWFDHEGRFRYANPAGCRALGYALDELLDMHIADVNPRATSERWAEVFRMFREQGSATMETVHRRKDGSTFPVEITSTYFTHAGHEYCTGFAVDLTARQRSEREREQLQQQLLQAQKMESIGRLAGGVAHDFNNMLGVIIGHTELAAKTVGASHPVRADLTEIRAAAERSAALTRQLLAFARKQPVAPRVLDLNETVDGMLKMLRRLIGEEIALRFEPATDIFPVKMDRSQVHQILANLCVNARDAISGVGIVSIRTENVSLDDAHVSDDGTPAAGDWVKLSVRDDGCGMDEEQRKHLFEPFFTTKEVGQGTGLGLAMVYGIVKQNGGFIDVQSKPGAGTTMSIYLPRHQGNASRSGEHAVRAPLEGLETLLLVEDEPALLRVTARALENLGYRVLSTNSPNEALHLAEQHPGQIDLLVTDVVMPEMNGRQLADELSTRFPGLRCLYISGYTADLIAQHGVLEEGVHFLQKPFSSATLGAQVRAVLEDRVPTRGDASTRAPNRA